MNHYISNWLLFENDEATVFCLFDERICDDNAYTSK